jgi:hypothetical protein
MEDIRSRVWRPAKALDKRPGAGGFEPTKVSLKWLMICYTVLLGVVNAFVPVIIIAVITDLSGIKWELFLPWLYFIPALILKKF